MGIEKTPEKSFETSDFSSLDADKRLLKYLKKCKNDGVSMARAISLFFEEVPVPVLFLATSEGIFKKAATLIAKNLSDEQMRLFLSFTPEDESMKRIRGTLEIAAPFQAEGKTPGQFVMSYMNSPIQEKPGGMEIDENNALDMVLRGVGQPGKIREISRRAGLDTTMARAYAVGLFMDVRFIRHFAGAGVPSTPPTDLDIMEAGIFLRGILFGDTPSTKDMFFQDRKQILGEWGELLAKDNLFSEMIKSLSQDKSLETIFTEKKISDSPFLRRVGKDITNFGEGVAIIMDRILVEKSAFASPSSENLDMSM